MIPLERIKAISANDPNPLLASVLKLQEEVGEVAAAALATYGFQNRSASATPNIEEELVDVIIVACDLLHKLNATNEQIETLFNTKLDKWVMKLS